MAPKANSRKKPAPTWSSAGFQCRLGKNGQVKISSATGEAGRTHMPGRFKTLDDAKRAADVFVEDHLKNNGISADDLWAEAEKSCTKKLMVDVDAAHKVLAADTPGAADLATEGKRVASAMVAARPHLQADRFSKHSGEYQEALTALVHTHALVLAAQLGVSLREAEEEAGEEGSTGWDAVARLQVAVDDATSTERKWLERGGTTAGGAVESDPGRVVSQALASGRDACARLRTERVTRTVDAARKVLDTGTQAGAADLAAEGKRVASAVGAVGPHLQADHFAKHSGEYQEALTALVHTRAHLLAAQLGVALREAEEEAGEEGSTGWDAVARLQVALDGATQAERKWLERGGITAGGTVESDPGRVVSQALASGWDACTLLTIECIARPVDAARDLRTLSPPADMLGRARWVQQRRTALMDLQEGLTCVSFMLRADEFPMVPKDCQLALTGMVHECPLTLAAYCRAAVLDAEETARVAKAAHATVSLTGASEEQKDTAEEAEEDAVGSFWTLTAALDASLDVVRGWLAQGGFTAGGRVQLDPGGAGWQVRAPWPQHTLPLPTPHRPLPSPRSAAAVGVCSDIHQRAYTRRRSSMPRPCAWRWAVGSVRSRCASDPGSTSRCANCRLCSSQ